MPAIGARPRSRSHEPEQSSPGHAGQARPGPASASQRRGPGRPARGPTARASSSRGTLAEARGTAPGPARHGSRIAGRGGGENRDLRVGEIGRMLALGESRAAARSPRVARGLVVRRSWARHAQRRDAGPRLTRRTRRARRRRTAQSCGEPSAVVIVHEQLASSSGRSSVAARAGTAGNDRGIGSRLEISRAQAPSKAATLAVRWATAPLARARCVTPGLQDPHVRDRTDGPASRG